MTRRPFFHALLLALLAILVPAASAQPQPPTSDEAAAAARLRVYLLTMGPGDEVWEQFGHNAIEIVDPARDLDFAANWGVFDFFEKGFYKRFILGQMLYRMEIDDAPRTVDYYRHFNRSVFRQELNLSPRQKAALYNYIIWNSQPENRNYRYDYYRDNCSTRVRDVLDRATDGQIAPQLQPQPTDTTYRWHTRRIMASDLPLYTSLLFILGQPVDHPISAWQESFLPLRLMDHLRNVTILDDAGNRVPLIKSEETLFTAARPPQRTAPPNWLLPFLALGLLCAATFATLAHFARRSKLARVLFFLLATIWSFFIGGAGTFALWGWLCTEHTAVYYNENILHFLPLSLPLAFLLPFAARNRRRCATVARYLALATAAVSLLGLLLKLLPAFYQVNYELIAWVLPTHLALAYGLWTLTRRPITSAPQPQEATSSNRTSPTAS